MSEAALRAVLKHYGNNYALLAQAVGISRQAVRLWRTIPPEHVLLIERLTGVSRYRIRPDIFGPEQKVPMEN